jgi:hypothetical protein
MRLPLFICMATAFALAAPARADVERYAVIIGNNTGIGDDVDLRYAEEDARRIARILRELGNFPPENVVELTDGSSDDVRRVLLRQNARIRNQEAAQSVLFVFFSGHGDESSLHMRRSEFPMAELRDLLRGSAATARVLVIDACRSGAMTRIKGGRPGLGFAIKVDQEMLAEGTAILTSSAAGEDSQESDDLKASFFTHFLASALRGAADQDGSGDVTLAEAFQYASEKTWAATARTAAGPQHPTYRYDLGGRVDLTLTTLRNDRFATLVFDEPGIYLIEETIGRRAPVAEINVSGKAKSLVVPVGRYSITRRAADHLLVGHVDASAQHMTPVKTTAMERIAYAKVVRKGGTDANSALSMYVSGGARSSILGLGIGPRLELGTRVDFASLSLEGRLGYAESVGDNLNLAKKLHELSVSVLALRGIDFGAATLSAGLEAGGVLFRQRFAMEVVDVPARHVSALLFGPVAQAQIAMSSRLYVKVEGAVSTYLVRSADEDDTGWRSPLAGRFTLGFGSYF